MPVYHGKNGVVNFSASDIAAVLSWTLTTTGDVADGTYMRLNSRIFESGFIDCSVTVDCNARTEDTTKAGGAAAQLKLYINDTYYFDVNTAICTEQTETVNLDDVGKVTYSFAMDDITGVSYT